MWAGVRGLRQIWLKITLNRVQNAALMLLNEKVIAIKHLVIKTAFALSSPSAKFGFIGGLVARSPEGCNRQIQRFFILILVSFNHREISAEHRRKQRHQFCILHDR